MPLANYTFLDRFLLGKNQYTKMPLRFPKMFFRQHDSWRLLVVDIYELRSFSQKDMGPRETQFFLLKYKKSK
jgi:hypothetical protein